MSKTHKNLQRFKGFESLQEIGDDVNEQVNVKSSWDEVWRELFGAKDESSINAPLSSDHLRVTDVVTNKKDVVFDASKHQNASENAHKEKAHLQKDSALNYHGDFLKTSERASKHEMNQLNQRFNEINAELQKLINSSNVLKMEFGGAAVDQAPKQAGEYHVNFLDWLLDTIREARKKVENSGIWLAAKKKKGKGSWNNKQRKDWFSNTSLSMGNESGGGYINQTG